MLLLTLALGFVMAWIDVTAVNTALSDIATDLHVPLAGLVWVVDGYTLTFAALLLAGGALADRVGPRRAYQAGLLVFVAGSVLCALAPSGTLLVAARLLQGAGAALFMPSSLSLLAQSTADEGARARMFGIWSALVSAAATVGPLAGGLLVHAFGWRSIFWLNVPLGLAGLALTFAVVPPGAAHPDRPLALSSHAIAAVALAALAYVLIEGPAQGWTAPAVLAAGMALLVLGGWAVRRERVGTTSMLPRALYGNAGFGAAVAMGFLVNFGFFAQLFVISLFLQQGHGIGALETGVRLLPMMAVTGVTNLLAGRVIARRGVRWPLLLGLGGAAGAALLLTGVAGAATPNLVVAGGTLVTLSLGLAIPAMTATVMQAGGRAYANSAAAALNANRQVGALVGVAVAGTVLHLADAWPARLALVFGITAAGFALAWLLVFLHVQRAAARAPAAPALAD
ncbi:MFS transporter [[Empedobacter] haloabium]|uniref:MFS transporter n=1 Tax=[Empedobacter] haloabium TaxID=592317 RepID=A0ABZ1UFQ7_9BURK